jgi:hypothetical protein
VQTVKLVKEWNFDATATALTIKRRKSETNRTERISTLWGTKRQWRYFAYSKQDNIGGRQSLLLALEIQRMSTQL